ncbi:MAG: tetraacyldisaccharide 4'-kinase [Gammaproteobacteria bacterium]
MIHLLSSLPAKIWYQDSLVSRCLQPVSVVYAGAVRLRRFFYRSGLLHRCRLPVPVIVVGNITVGGTGKTPLIIWLAGFLKAAGYRPGIISRGYGGKVEQWPHRVDTASDAKTVGDEAVLIALKTGCPMAVAPKRSDAAKMLIDQSDCNIILSDDGLQHYALHRDIEIAVIDGDRRFGNGRCLPAGPLREPLARLNDVDFVVVNGKNAGQNEFTMRLDGDMAIRLVGGEEKPLQAFSGRECYAVAGIGNPARFFKHLEAHGIFCNTRVFPDHHPFKSRDVAFGDDKPVFMTEKDAVKCKEFAGEQHWSVPVTAVLEPNFSEQLIKLLREKHGR